MIKPELDFKTSSVSQVFQMLQPYESSFLLHLKSPLFFRLHNSSSEKTQVKLCPNSGSVVFFEELAPDIKSPSKVTEGSLWQADHVVPVWRGGGLCGLENLQTLCTACHSAKTKAEARERKEDPRMGGILASQLS